MKYIEKKIVISLTEVCLFNVVLSEMNIKLKKSKIVTYGRRRLIFTVMNICVMQDGEIWTFSVRAFDVPRPERAITVNYDGFSEGWTSIILS